MKQVVECFLKTGYVIKSINLTHRAFHIDHRTKTLYVSEYLNLFEKREAFIKATKLIMLKEKK